MFLNKTYDDVDDDDDKRSYSGERPSLDIEHTPYNSFIQRVKVQYCIIFIT